jgi:hypothetical protein
MKSTDSHLRQMFVRATDEVIPPAPWLESRVVDAVQQRKRARRNPIALGALGGFGSGLRLAAAVAALAIAVATIAALLMSSRLLHIPTVPGNGSKPVQTPLPAQTIPFAPSPAVRASNWPPGTPVPAQLAGAWQPPLSSEICKLAGSSGCILHLGAYTFQVGEEYPDGTSDSGTIGPPLFGNVVVNGSEIDFISDICGAGASFAVERFDYTLNGNVLVITRAPDPGQSSCTWVVGPSLWPYLAGTYTRLSAPS